jgi:rhamnosyltransferase
MRRLILFHFFDPQGIVDDSVLHVLRALRPHAAHLMVVSNSALDDDQLGRLEQIVDEVRQRENVGYDVVAFRETLDQLGPERLAEYDELMFTNCTYFGPVGSFDDAFAQVDGDETLDFWGLTEHAEVVPHPWLADEPRMPAHIQSHWLAVRRSVFDTEVFRDFWRTIPSAPTYLEAVSLYEARFTQYFLDAGFRHRVLYPAADYPTRHPVMETPGLLLRDGCPIVKRRLLFRDSNHLERDGLLGREVVAQMEAAGYPVDLLYANLARTVQPRALATNLGLLEVLPAVDQGYDREHPLRVVAVAHIYYPEMTDEILDRFETLPPGWDLVVTTPEAERADAVRAILDRRGIEGDVRLVDNRGRDISAFYVGCRDLIEGDDYDLIVKLHSKKSPQDAPGVGDLFKRHLFENLLASPGHTANVLRLFQQHRTLGMVFPPVVHIGYPTLGHAWFLNKRPAQAEAERLGIHVPFDDSTPLAAYGSMFIARPAALRPMLRGGYDYADFPDNSGYTDGALTHVLERLVSYGSLSAGMHVREVLTPELAAINYRFLEYKTQSVTARLDDGYALEQIAQLRHLKATAVQAVKLQRQLTRVREKMGRIKDRNTALREQLARATAQQEVAPRPVLKRALGPAYRAVRRAGRR